MRNKCRGYRATLVASLCVLGLTSCATGEYGTGITGSLTAIGSVSQNGPISAWQQGWTKDNPQTSLRFSPDGDPIARDALFRGMAHFASIDSQLTADEWQKSKEVCGSEGAFAVPTSVTAIGVAYNVAGLRNVKLDQEVLGEIFQGRITTWNDEQIEALNPGESLPDLEIVPIWVESESGLTQAAGDYLASATRGSSNQAPAVSRKWPADTAGTPVATYGDIATEVDNTAGAIAFMDRAAIGTRFSTATLKFGDQFVKVTDDALSMAIESAQVSEAPGGGVELNLQVGQPPGYSLGFVGYQAFCHTYKNPALALIVKSWAAYVTGEGGQANSTYFAQVGSPNVEALKRSQTAVKSIKAQQNDQQ